MMRLGRLLGAVSVLALATGIGGCATDESVVPGTVIDASFAAAAAGAEAAGDYRTAVAHYRALHVRYPSEVTYATRLARALRLAGEPRVAALFLENFKDAQKKTTVELLIELGKCYLATDQMNLAVRYLIEARGLAPDSWETLSMLGVVYDYQSRYAEARQAYDAALAISPDNPAVLNNLALSLAMASDLSAAIATLEKANDQPRASAQIRQNLALLLAIKGDAAGAERFARKDMAPEAVRHNLRFFRALADSVRNY